jgi:hypothetical protein
MRYIDFKSKILTELKRHPRGFTWGELKSRLDLPYKTPCQEWVNRMESEDGLRRVKGDGRALVWRIMK